MRLFCEFKLLLKIVDLVLIGDLILQARRPLSRREIRRENHPEIRRRHTINIERSFKDLRCLR